MGLPVSPISDASGLRDRSTTRTRRAKVTLALIGFLAIAATACSREDSGAARGSAARREEPASGAPAPEPAQSAPNPPAGESANVPSDAGTTHGTMTSGGASGGASAVGAQQTDLAPIPRHGARADRLVLLALDGADWKVIRPLIAKGRLPNLARLVREGSSGDLATLKPALSPVVWTTIATGVSPRVHGITDFWHEAPGGEQLLSPQEREHQEQLGALGYISSPSGSTSRMMLFRSDERRFPALWTILERSGLESDVVAWWVTYPAEVMRGVMVSDRFLYDRFALVAKARGLADDAQRGLITPASMEPALRSQVVRVEDVGVSELNAFITGPVRLHPGLTIHEPEDELRIVIAKDRSSTRIAKHLLTLGRPALLAVYLQGIDITSHYFYKYRFPEEWNALYPNDPIPAAEQARYGKVIDRYYERVDKLIGEIRSAAGRDAAIVVCSDHGFVAGKRPPGTLGAASSVSGVHEEAAPPGILIVSGRGAVAGGSIARAQVLDVAPTILAILGVQAPAGLEGSALRSALVPPPAN